MSNSQKNMVLRKTRLKIFFWCKEYLHLICALWTMQNFFSFSWWKCCCFNLSSHTYHKIWHPNVFHHIWKIVRFYCLFTFLQTTQRILKYNTAYGKVKKQIVSYRTVKLDQPKFQSYRIFQFRRNSTYEPGITFPSKAVTVTVYFSRCVLRSSLLFLSILIFSF